MTVLSPAAAAGWFSVFAVAAAVEGLRANHRMRDDWWDRRLQGATTWGRVRWILFDRDARRVVGGYVTAAVWCVFAVAVPAVAYPVETVAAAGVVAALVGAAVRRRRRNRRRVRPQRPGRTYGCYTIAARDPDTGADLHGKLGYGHIASRLKAHRTAVGAMRVHRIRWTATKADAYRVEQTLKDALDRAGLLIDYDPDDGQRAVELFRATPEAWRIVDEILGGDR